MRILPLDPLRVRCPRGPYGWVDLNVVTGGFLERLGADAALTYLFLCAVGNAHGLSFWSRGRMARTMGLDLVAVETAMNKLQAADLIATDGKLVQVLPIETGIKTDRPVDSLPSVAVVPAAPAASRTTVDGLTEESARSTDLVEDEDEIRVHETEARRRLMRFTHASPERIRRLAMALALEARNGGGCGERPEETRRGSHD